MFDTTKDGLQYYLESIRSSNTGIKTIPLIGTLRCIKEWIQEQHPLGSKHDCLLYAKNDNNHGSILTCEDLV